MGINAKDIQKLGLSEPQSRVYFYLLANPEKGPKEIATSLEMTHARILQIIQELKRNELVVDMQRGRNTYYLVNDIKFLARFSKNLTKSREEEIISTKKAQEDILETIKEHYGNEDDFVIESYDGVEGIEKSIHILHEQSPDEIYQLTNFEEINFPKIKKTFSKNIPKTSVYTAIKKEDNNSGAVYLPYSVFSDIQSNIVVFKTTVVITNTSKDKYKRLIIKNRQLASTFKVLIKYLYGSNKKSN